MLQRQKLPLSPDEQQSYDIMSDLYSRYTTGYVLDDSLAKFYSEDGFTDAVKWNMAIEFSQSSASEHWGCLNFKGETLEVFLQNRFITLQAVRLLAKNPHLTNAAIVNLLSGGYTGAHSKNEFMQMLPDEFWTKDIILWLVSIKDFAGINLEIVAPKAREFYGIDENIPDSWVVKILGTVGTLV